MYPVTTVNSLTGAGLDLSYSDTLIPAPIIDTSLTLPPLNGGTSGSGGFLQNVTGGLDLVGTVGSFVGGLLPGGSFDCIGASWNPDKAVKEHNKLKATFDSQFNAVSIIDKRSIDQANRMLIAYANSYIEQVTYQASGKPKDCTKRGIDKFVELNTSLMNQYVSAFKQKLQSTRVETRITSTQIHDNVGKYRGSINVPQLSYVKTLSASDSIPTKGMQQFNTPTISDTPDVYGPNPDQPKKKSFPWWLILLLLGLLKK
ncbi:hypothetical protein GWK08_08900 [Leptobacterium flavescens]|uniref:Uncharacterized protein n=1 Tax=Leptobacterium flavescens TaxID=472055 RepID=A0A6P0ULX0_9FLAO|nr:hypothetical protein [Leptobacterium flavescens]NER13552.1 hypothetical protein [Leptobacterium flavescens]